MLINQRFAIKSSGFLKLNIHQTIIGNFWILSFLNKPFIDHFPDHYQTPSFHINIITFAHETKTCVSPNTPPCTDTNNEKAIKF